MLHIALFSSKFSHAYLSTDIITVCSMAVTSALIGGGVGCILIYPCSALEINLIKVAPCIWFLPGINHFVCPQFTFTENI